MAGRLTLVKDDDLSSKSRVLFFDAPGSPPEIILEEGQLIDPEHHPDMRWLGEAEFYVSTDGFVAMLANVDDPSKAPRPLSFPLRAVVAGPPLPSHLTVLAYDGQQGEGSAGYIRDIHLNASSRLAFLLGGAVWVNTLQGTPRLEPNIAYPGMPASSVFTTAYHPFELNAHDDLFVDAAAYVESSFTYLRGYWVRDADTFRPFLLDGPSPVSPEKTIRISAFAFTRNSRYFTDSGWCGVKTQHVGPPSRQAIYVGKPGNPGFVVEAGMATPEMDGAFGSELRFEGISNAGDALFRNQMMLATGETPNSYWRWSEGKLELVAKEGQTVPGFQEETLDGLDGPERAAISAEGVVVFHANVSPNGDDALFIQERAGQPIRKLLGNGDPFTYPDGIEQTVGLVDLVVPPNGPRFDTRGRFLAQILVLDDDLTTSLMWVDPGPPHVSTISADVTMHRVDEASANNWQGESTNPIEPSANRDILGTDATEISKGLVADGLTPLVFKISSKTITEETDVLWTCEPKVAGQDYVEGGILSKMKSLRVAAWQPAALGGGNLVTLSPGGSGFVQLGAIKAWELDLSAAGEPELTYVFKLLEPGQGGAVIDSLEFKIRRPPLVRIPSYPSEEWGDEFMAEFRTGRHREFIFEAGSPDAPEIKLEMWVAKVRGFLETLRGSGWAVTRADLLTHGTGGLYARLLCSEINYPANNKALNFRATGDAFRGYFHRVITIGSPHLLLQGELQMYVRALEKALANLPTSRKIPNYIPETISRIPAYSRLTGIDGLAYVNRIGRLLVEPSKNVDFHLIATQIDASRSQAFDYLRLLRPALSEPRLNRLDLIAPVGSDGVSSIRNALLGGSTAGPGRTWVMPPDYAAFGDHGGFDFNFAPRQTHSANVGKIAAAALETPDPRSFFPASEFPRAFDEVTVDIITNVTRKIRSEVQSALWATLFEILLVQDGNGGQAPRGNDNSTIFTFEVAELLGEPIAGDPSWWAEAYGPDGATIEGLDVRPIPGDPARVEVEVAESVLGDVVLFGSYASQGNAIVFGAPVLVTSQLPAAAKGAPDLELGSDTLDVGAVVGPVVYDNYNDGTRLRRWLTAADMVVTSSDPAVVDVTDEMNWVATAPGSTTITVGFDGTRAQIAVTVVDSFPPLTRQQWIEQFFSPGEIADPGITGDDVDLDGDGLNTILERITGGDPRGPNPGHLPQVTTLPIGGGEQLAIRIRVSNRLAGETVVMQESADLATWSELPFDGPELLTQLDFGPFTDYWFDVGDAAPGDRYYRLAINPGGG
ncbi:MAG: hypothetical protein R3F19_23255 [Verrucomicrobiales bacterium]